MKKVLDLLPHHFLEMGDQAHAGEEAILMRDGQP
jgi:hypothetical protein